MIALAAHRNAFEGAFVKIHEPLPIPGDQVGVRVANGLLQDAISGVTYEQNGDETTGPGLYVELGPWNYSFFQLKEEISGNKPLPISA